MVSPGLILECVLFSLVIVIAPFVIACCSGDTINNNHDQQQAVDGDEEAVQKQMASVAMALLDWVIYSRRQNTTTTSAGDPSTSTAVSVEDCAICLGQFEDGDRCSIMPLCRHEFHRNCIADWLMAYNNTCPLCRGQLQWSAVAENMV